jgi:hypothetical protein
MQTLQRIGFLQSMFQGIHASIIDDRQHGVFDVELIAMLASGLHHEITEKA